MKTDHLTDEIIQSYILQEISDNEITVHISECADCKAKLKSYQTLMDTISGIEPEAFSFDVTEMVLRKIETTETQRTALGSYVLLTMLNVFILGIILFSFSIIKPIFQLFWSLDFFGNAFIIVSTVGVFTFLFIDTLRKYRQMEKLLLQ